MKKRSRIRFNPATQGKIKRQSGECMRQHSLLYYPVPSILLLMEGGKGGR